MLGGLGVSWVPWEAFLGLEGARLAANGSRSYHFGSMFDGFGMDFRVEITLESMYCFE